MRQVEHPSTRAASISSSLTADAAYWRIMNTPNPLTRNGTMTAWRVSVQPSFTMIMYSGMMPSWVGTIMVTMMISSSALRPLNFSFANAKPARVEKNTTDSVTTVDTMAEFTSPYTKLASVLFSTRDTFVPSWLPGVNGGGISYTELFSRVAMMNDHRIGKIDSTTAMISPR